MTKTENAARFHALLAAASARTPGHAAAVAAHKAAGEAYARANPTRYLSDADAAARPEDDGWGDFCSPVEGDV